MLYTGNTYIIIDSFKVTNTCVCTLCTYKRIYLKVPVAACTEHMQNNVALFLLNERHNLMDCLFCPHIYICMCVIVIKFGKQISTFWPAPRP